MSVILDTYGFPSKAEMSLPGVVGASRYISHDSGKCITRSQVLTLFSWNRVVDLNFEDSATNAQLGASQGALDATFAVAIARALGAPREVCIYYSADFAYSPTTWAAELAYFATAARITRAAGYVMGAYGDYTTIGRLLNARVIDLGWQTTAWSNGRRDARGVLYQNTYTQGYDVDVIEANYWGAWTRTGAQLKPIVNKPKPKSVPAAPPVQEDDDKMVLLGYGQVSPGPHLINYQDGKGWRPILAALTEANAIKNGAQKDTYGEPDFAVYCKEAGVPA